jgi:hypothetical protein
MSILALNHGLFAMVVLFGLVGVCSVVAAVVAAEEWRWINDQD